MTQPCRWPLPLEITTTIITLVCSTGHQGYMPWDRRSYPRDVVPGVAPYACVCSEFREEVERLTFRKLYLNRARLADVKSIMCPRRWAYVHLVILAVEVEPYGKELYGEFETAEEKRRNSVIFSATLRLFFNVFSRWGPKRRHGDALDHDGEGMSLMIKAFSPSDPHYCDEAEKARRGRNCRNRDLSGDRFVRSILELVQPPDAAPSAVVDELPVVHGVSALHSSQDQHPSMTLHPSQDRQISSAAWASIVNSLPDVKMMRVHFWENEKKDVELRKRLRDEIGRSLARMRCPRGEVNLSCSYTAPTDHASTPPRLVDAHEADNDAFVRGFRTWSQQLKILYLSGVVLAPEMFSPPVASSAASGFDARELPEWPHLEELEIHCAPVTLHGSWLLERNPEDTPVDRPSPVVDFEEFDEDSLWREMPAWEDMYVHRFRTVPVATELDRLYDSLARAARRMPALRDIYLEIVDGGSGTDGPIYYDFYYRYNASRGVATAHWDYSVRYQPAVNVLELWKEMSREVHGCELQILFTKNLC